MDRQLNVVIFCEESQTICKAFRELGHIAFSCDLQECSGGHPEWHIHGDCLPYLDRLTAGFDFTTQDGQQQHIGPIDLMIAHPPCTHLCNAQNPLYNRSKFGDAYVDNRERERERAVEFFLRFAAAECPHKAIENPVGWMSNHYRKPDMIVQPYQHGEPYSKATCFWAWDLPKLIPTNILTKPQDGWKNHYKAKNGSTQRKYVDVNGKWLGWGTPEIKRLRSKTYQGIAKAIADQWSKYILTESSK